MTHLKIMHSTESHQRRRKEAKAQRKGGSKDNALTPTGNRQNVRQCLMSIVAYIGSGNKASKGWLLYYVP